VIVSHQHRFIFLHSRKTAGSAVTLGLLRLLGPDDLWLNAPAFWIMSDALRSGFVPPPATRPEMRGALVRRCGARFARRALKRPERLDHAGRKAFADAYNSLQLPYPRRDGGGWQHVGAATARDHLGPQVWDSYFKFSFERNPWERMVSLYWWRMRKERDAPPVPFRDFILAIASGDPDRMRAHRATKYSNWHIYTIGDEVAVDHLGRYETLADDLRSVLDKVGAPFQGIPRSKHDVRRGGLDGMYDRETARLVGEIFHREISLLGYESPLPPG
jgi:hypothetical protein